MNGDAIFGGFCIEGARGDFGGKVAADNFSTVCPIRSDQGLVDWETLREKVCA